VPESVISYAPRTDATQEAELNALANVYKFVLSEARHAQKEAAPESRPDDAERDLSDSASKHSTT
jgi:hypothetical protein